MHGGLSAYTHCDEKMHLLFAGKKSGERVPDSEPRLSSCCEAEAFVRLGEAPVPDRKQRCCEVLTESRFLMQNAKWELKHT